MANRTYDPTKSVDYYKEREKEAREKYQVLIEKLATKLKSNPRSERGALTISAKELNLFVDLIRNAEEELKSAEALTNTALMLEPQSEPMDLLGPKPEGIRSVYPCNCAVYREEKK